MALFPVQHPTDFEAMYAARNTLSLVCRRWHEVVMSTPQIWPSLGVDIDQRSPPLSIVGTWLRRASFIPINLLVFGEKRPSRQVQTYIVEVFRVVFRRRPVWRVLILDIGTPLSAFLPTIPLHQCSGLEAIKLNVGGYNAVGLGVLVDTVLSVPSLRRLTLECSPLEKVFNPGKPCFTQLTHLAIVTVRISASQLLAILRFCISTIVLDITAGETAESSSELANEERTTHPYIRVLNLDLNGIGYEIFAYLDFPNLEVLHHSEHFSTVPEGRRTLGPLEEWVRRSNHSLRVLRIRNPDISTEFSRLFLSPEVEQIPIVEFQVINPGRENRAGSPSFEDRMVDGIYVMNFPHLQDSSVRSVGWALPRAYTRMDDFELLAWGPEVYLLIIFGRMMWLATTELAQLERPVSTWGVDIVLAAFKQVSGVRVDPTIRRAQAAISHRSQPDTWELGS